jgi:hypothetical protein
LDLARKGLEDLGIKPSFLGHLEQRIENRSSPGDYAARKWLSAHNSGDDDKKNLAGAVLEVVSDVWERTRRNQPIF